MLPAEAKLKARVDTALIPDLLPWPSTNPMVITPRRLCPRRATARWTTRLPTSRACRRRWLRCGIGRMQWLVSSLCLMLVRGFGGIWGWMSSCKKWFGLSRQDLSSLRRLCASSMAKALGTVYNRPSPSSQSNHHQPPSFAQ